MFYCSNILSTIDSNCPSGWKEEDDGEEDCLTGALKTRELTSMEVVQVNAFMLCNSTVMELWREFYENAKSESRRQRIFPKLHDYMQCMLKELDAMVERGESLSHFPEVTNDVRTLVHGPLRKVTTQTAMWTQGRHFRVAELDEKRARTFDCGVQGEFTQDSRSNRHDRNMRREIIP
jgi:hypothetical protein